MNALRAGVLRMVVLVVAMLAAIGAWEISKGTVLKAQSYNHEPGVTPPDAPLDHFVCYKVIGPHEEPRFKAIVEIRNQFEYSRIRVKDDEKLLCVPSAKTLLSLEPKGDNDD